MGMKLPPDLDRKVRAMADAQGQRPGPPSGSRSKYKNSRLDTPDGKFDSKKEYRRWLRLKEMLLAGAVHFLRRQVSYRLEVNGVLVARYVADFAYVEGGRLVVEDVKSAYTARLPVYRMKKRLMKALHNIEIKEV